MYSICVAGEFLFLLEGKWLCGTGLYRSQFGSAGKFCPLLSPLLGSYFLPLCILFFAYNFLNLLFPVLCPFFQFFGRKGRSHTFALGSLGATALRPETFGSGALTLRPFTLGGVRPAAVSGAWPAADLALPVN